MTTVRWFGTGAARPVRAGNRGARALAVAVGGGLLLFVFGPAAPVAFVGALLWGAGASLGFPVGMSAAADEPGPRRRPGQRHLLDRLLRVPRRPAADRAARPARHGAARADRRRRPAGRRRRDRRRAAAPRGRALTAPPRPGSPRRRRLWSDRPGNAGRAPGRRRGRRGPAQRRGGRGGHHRPVVGVAVRRARDDRAGDRPEAGRRRRGRGGRAAVRRARSPTGPGTPTRCSARIEVVDDLEDAVRDADVVQENAPERLPLKQELFARIEAVVARADADRLLDARRSCPATSPGRCAPPSGWSSATRSTRREVLPLVEVVPGERTADWAVQAAVDLYRGIGKHPVVLHKEINGFVANRLQSTLFRECVWLVSQGVVSAAELDEIVTQSIGVRWATAGPFESFHLGGGPGGHAALPRAPGPRHGPAVEGRGAAGAGRGDGRAGSAARSRSASPAAATRS